jgi:phosphopantetheinyl transferase (holo-ACP synthase)
MYRSGVGIDIVENKRIKKMVNDTFISHILSESEEKEYS